MPVTVCWSVKGGSGTTVVAAALALADPAHCTLVDLDGELPTVLGLDDPAGQGIGDWLASDAPGSSLADLTVEVDATTVLVPCGRHDVDRQSPRWAELATWLRTRPSAVVDAGTGAPPAGLVEAGGRSVLVTRGCYLGLRRAARVGHRPDGVVLVAEPGRSLGASDVGRAIGAPVIAVVSVDPAVARAVDAGLLTARLPRLLLREVRRLADQHPPRQRPRARLLTAASR
ncbi:MAG: hypothetical protein ACR2HP_19110 [Ilumatobacteraceae bacterium]